MYKTLKWNTSVLKTNFLWKLYYITQALISYYIKKQTKKDSEKTQMFCAGTFV